MRSRGFTLVEALVALAIGGLAAAASFRLLHGAQRAYRLHAARIQLDHEVRAALGILTAELRALAANDPDGSDIVAMTPSSLTYRSSTGIRFLCQPPDPSQRRIVLAASPAFGSRDISSARASLLLHAALDTAARANGRWLRVTAERRSEGAACPGGRPGTVLGLADVSASELMLVENGAPVRSQQLVRIQAYRDGDGVYWLGAKETAHDGSWGDLQPFAGPVSAGGLHFEYFSARGSVAVAPTDVAMVGVAVTGRAAERGATLGLSTLVTLRNNLRE